MELFRQTNIDFLKYKWWAIGASWALILVGVFTRVHRQTGLIGLVVGLSYGFSAIVGEAQTLGLTLDLAPLRFIMHRAVTQALDAIAESASSERVARATALIEGARRLGIPYGHWATQNRFFQLWRERPDARDVLLPLATTLGFSLAR